MALRYWTLTMTVLLLDPDLWLLRRKGRRYGFSPVSVATL